MLAAPAAGWFLDRVGLEAGIVCAVAFWSIAAAVSGWTRSLTQLIGARVFLGAWESAGVPAAGKLNSIYLEPQNRALGAAVTQVGIAIGMMAAPLLVRQFSGWRTPFFVCSALGLAWIPVWLWVRRRVTPFQTVAPRRQGGGWDLLKDRRLLTLALANMLWMVAYTLWSNWTTIYLAKSFHLNDARANSFAWFPPVASTVGAFAGGWLSMRAIARGKGHVEARLFAMLISAIGCAVTVFAPFCPSPLWGTAVIAASYFWTTAGSVNLYTIPVDIWGGERAGMAISALVFAYGLLQTVASPVIGNIVDKFGFGPVCWLVALPPTLAWLLLRLTPLPEVIDNRIG